MYIHARQTSQGTQSIYNVEPPKARRFDPSFDLLLSLPTMGRSVSMLVDHMKKTQPMKIHVKTLDGRTIELITDEDEEIKDVRIMISNEIKKRPDNIAISFNGNEVNYRGTIISNGISEGDILEILDEIPTQMEEDDEDEDCGDIQNCSMSSSRMTPPSLPPRIRRAPVMQGYTMSSIEDSPYVELNTLVFMRETSRTIPTNSI
jgi:hypothetical protein